MLIRFAGQLAASFPFHFCFSFFFFSVSFISIFFTIQSRREYERQIADEEAQELQSFQVNFFLF